MKGGYFPIMSALEKMSLSSNYIVSDIKSINTSKETIDVDSWQLIEGFGYGLESCDFFFNEIVADKLYDALTGGLGFGADNIVDLTGALSFEPTNL
jgi:hypothetical protein